MSAKSGIEWTDATWNPVIGCTKVSPGCDNCYAIKTAHRMQANPNEKIHGAYAGTEHEGEWTGKVNLLGDRLDLPLRWGKPKRIFVNSQSDLFHDSVPDEFIARVFATMLLAPQHTFQVLTKRHARMRHLMNQLWFESTVRSEANRMDAGWPLSNVWLGVSVENQQWANIRIPALLDTPAAVRFLSCEPLLGPVDLLEALEASPPGHSIPDWVIAGGESGKEARPMDPRWVRWLRDECTAYGIPFHFKQWGEWCPEDQSPLDAVVPARFFHDESTDSIRFGKKMAGRVLDGRTWDEYPA